MSVDRAPLGGRAAAYLVILDVLRGKGFAADKLRELRLQGRLSGRDSGLATHIALGAVRHMIIIEQVLSAVARFDKRRDSRPVTGNPLRGGVPDHLDGSCPGFRHGG